MTDSFPLIISPEKFRSTNYLWNQLQLNSPYNVGYVSTLIESKHFDTKEEWRDYYFQSGEERLRKLQEWNISVHDKSHPKWKQLSGSHGRTEEELREIGKVLHEAIQKQGNPLQITLSESVWMVKYRVIGETWNGIILREKNTIQSLQQIFPSLTFKATTGEEDFTYAIDYKVYDSNGTLVAALQIKPKSYANGKTPAILKAKDANKIKNANYYNKFGVPVLYVYATNKGKILNQDVIQELANSLKNQNETMEKIS